MRGTAPARAPPSIGAIAGADLVYCLIVADRGRRPAEARCRRLSTARLEGPRVTGAHDPPLLFPRAVLFPRLGLYLTWIPISVASFSPEGLGDGVAVQADRFEIVREGVARLFGRWQVYLCLPGSWFW